MYLSARCGPVIEAVAKTATFCVDNPVLVRGAVIYTFTESLILAQDERWRRA